MKTIVIGGGPAGLAAAYTLSKYGASHDHEVELWEAAPAVGGMCRTIELWGHRVDLGPHRFFSTDRRVNALWLELAGRDYRMVDRLTRIYYKGKFFYYPLQPFNALWNLGPFEAVRCLTSYVQTRLSGQEAGDDFESWVTNRFGRRLYEIFFKTYSEKLWGIPCTRLDADFAAQRIKKLSLAQAVWAALKPGPDHKHKTLVSQFAYPVGGTGMIYERMAQAIERNGQKIWLERPARRVHVHHRRVTAVEDANGQVVPCDHVVSSMPITSLVKGLPALPQRVRQAVGQLRFRNTILVYLKVNGTDLFPDNWLYVHDSRLRTGRITNFRNWVPELCPDDGRTVLALEMWCYPEDALWQASDSDLIQLGRQDLALTGLVDPAAIEDGYVVRIPRCYPVYEKGYKAHVQVIRDYLDTIEGLHVIGRYGAFKYNNQDHSLLMGLLAAKNIHEHARHDLWGINTDYETYQERSLISQTGLVEI